MWPFGGKKTTPEQSDRSRLIELADRWLSFGSEELDQPHLERKLKTLADELDREIETYRNILQAAGERGTIEDADFLFRVLIELPEPPAVEREKGERRRDEDQDSPLAPRPSPFPSAEFSWERAEQELGAIARVASAIRVSIQQRIRRGWEKNLSALEKRVQALSTPSTKHPTPDTALLQAREELESTRQAERKELSQVDGEFRGYLDSLRRLHELYNVALKSLAGVKSDDGEAEIIGTLRSDVHGLRAAAFKVLKTRGFVPTTTEEKLDFFIVPAKMPETEAEGSKKLAEVIRGTNSVPELLDVIEPRLAEEGLTELQALLLEHLCTLHSEKALDRLAQVLASSLEPPSLKIKVAQALPDFGTPRAVELLIKAMDELDMEVRSAAADALGQVARRQPPGETDQPGPTGNEPQATSLEQPAPAPESGMPAAWSLQLGLAMARLVFALRDGDILVRETAARALKHYPDARDRLVTSLTAERNPNAREYAAKALENFTPEPASTEALIVALKDEDSAVRLAAAEALAKQRQVPEDPELKIRYLCARQNWKELRKIGRPATGCLVSLIRDRNEAIRLSVVELLGDIRAADAVKELCVSLSDSTQEVRREAAIALRLINDAAARDALKTALVKEGFKEVKAEIQRALDRFQ
jgi:HEAT repeat protein